jgi:hypothetical protein
MLHEDGRGFLPLIAKRQQERVHRPVSHEHPGTYGHYNRQKENERSDDSVQVAGPLPPDATAMHLADSASPPAFGEIESLARRFTLPALTLAAVSK